MRSTKGSKNKKPSDKKGCSRPRGWRKMCNWMVLAKYKFIVKVQRSKIFRISSRWRNLKFELHCSFEGNSTWIARNHFFLFGCGSHDQCSSRFNAIEILFAKGKDVCYFCCEALSPLKCEIWRQLKLNFSCCLIYMYK